MLPSLNKVILLLLLLELEVRTATYGPGIDQSQHAKSVSHIIMVNILKTETLRDNSLA